jgi:hypothetical protein
MLIILVPLTISGPNHVFQKKLGKAASVLRKIRKTTNKEQI